MQQQFTSLGWSRPFENIQGRLDNHILGFTGLGLHMAATDAESVIKPQRPLIHNVRMATSRDIDVEQSTRLLLKLRVTRGYAEHGHTSA